MWKKKESSPTTKTTNILNSAKNYYISDSSTKICYNKKEGKTETETHIQKKATLKQAYNQIGD